MSTFLVERRTFPRPEPQNTGWLGAAGVPRAPFIAPLAAPSVVAARAPGRPPLFESMASWSWFYGLPPATLSTPSISQAAQLVDVALARFIGFDAAPVSAWLANVLATGPTVAQTAPAVTQRKSFVVDRAAERALMFEAMASWARFYGLPVPPFAALVRAPSFLVGARQGRAIQFESLASWLFAVPPAPSALFDVTRPLTATWLGPIRAATWLGPVRKAEPL